MESLPVGLGLESTVQAQPNSPPSFNLLLTGGVLDAPAASMVVDVHASPIPRLCVIDKDLHAPLANPTSLRPSPSRRCHPRRTRNRNRRRPLSSTRGPYTP